MGVKYHGSFPPGSATLSFMVCITWANSFISKASFADSTTGYRSLHVVPLLRRVL